MDRTDLITHNRSQIQIFLYSSDILEQSACHFGRHLLGRRHWWVVISAEGPGLLGMVAVAGARVSRLGHISTWFHRVYVDYNSVVIDWIGR